MRIAYCEDVSIQAVYLKELIHEWESLGNLYCDITIYSSAEEMLFEHPESFPFDFILLDIELDKMNGIQLARYIRAFDSQVMIAFLSNSTEYVFEGYEVAAVRYLIKPISREQLFPLLDLIQKSEPIDKEYIIVSSAGDKIKLYLEDILYIEAQGHYISIHTEVKTYELKMNMNDMATKLSKRFVATHRSYLVNLKHMERITKTDCILRGERRVPISRSSYKAVNQAFIDYYKGGILA